MTYRTLKIEDVKYEFVIGKKYTKVKKDGKQYKVWENSIIGSPHGNSNGDLTGHYIVTPLNVRLAIEGKGLPTFHCKDHGVITHSLCADPFNVEIYKSVHYVTNCKQCLDNSACSI